MFELFTSRMSGAYEQVRHDQRLEQGSTLVKSYVVEAHRPNDEGPAAQWFADVLAETHLGPIKDATVHESDDEYMFTVSADTRAGDVKLFVDTADHRYWFAHTLSGSKAADTLVDRVVRGHRSMDRAWLPSDALERFAGLGTFRGLGLDFDRRQLGDLPDDDDAEDDRPVEFLKMQLWGSRAGDVLAKLRESGAFPGQTTLSKIRVKYWLDSGDAELFSLDDLRWDGKSTARGTSFDSHNELLTSVMRSYEAGVRRIEEDFALRVEADDEVARIAGAPLTFAFKMPVDDLEAFSAALFAGREPFRLWGVPTRASDSMVRVQAVDLHIGAPLSFDVTRDFMRVYVPQGTCGNSVYRLYANLQHYYDAQVRVFDVDGGDAVALQP